jgi:hypothetical protein
MANALDMLFQAANALPAPVPGDNEVQVQCVATLFLFASGQEITAQGPLQFTRGTVSETRDEPAFFSASSFSGPEGDVDNPLSFQTKITLTAPAIRQHPPGGYILTVQVAPIFSQTLSFTPNAVLENGTYHITASSSQNYAFLTLFAPIAIDL